MAAEIPLNRLARVLRRVSEDLSALGQHWALVGALAVSARTEPRFTRDIDIAIAVTDDGAAEALARDLQERHYRVHAIVEQEATGRLATARLLPGDEDEPGVVVDLLFASSGIEREIVHSAETLEIFSGLQLPVARVGHLIALKVLAMDDMTRPHDRADLVNLVAVAEPGDLEQARAAVAMITDRGFHRGKSLAADLEQMVRARG